MAIKATGNVYSFEAVNELNLKIKSFKDLLSDEPFKKSDIITLQNPDDPAHAALRDISNFKHLQTMRDEAAASRSSSGESSHVRHNPTSDRVMQTLKKQLKEKKVADDAAAKVAKENKMNEADTDVKNILVLSPTCDDVTPGSVITDQRAGGSLTSSSVDVHTKNATRLPTADEIRSARWRHMRKVIMYLCVALHLVISFCAFSWEKRVTFNFKLRWVISIWRFTAIGWLIPFFSWP